MQDDKYIQRCIEIARQGELNVAPNPMVGCVIVHNGAIVAEGYHEQYGEAHAEVNAFKKLDDAIPINECDVYVNLEPCSHFGKTPPCANLIAAKKPKKVIVGMLDPHSKVAGRGVKKLLESGIDVRVGVLEQECKKLNKRFVKAHTHNLPYITLKWAETKNGYMARVPGNQGSSQISDAVNNIRVHTLRATHQGILVGAHTINSDKPRLDVRGVDGNNPAKIVLSKDLSADLSSATFTQGKTLIYNSIRNEKTANYELIMMKNFSLDQILTDIHSRDIHSVLVEGGAQVLTTFIEQKMWDEAIILKSNMEWNSGIKAPWLGIPSVREETSGNDTIKYFLPK